MEIVTIWNEERQKKLLGIFFSHSYRAEKNNIGKTWICSYFSSTRLIINIFISKFFFLLFFIHNVCLQATRKWIASMSIFPVGIFIYVFLTREFIFISYFQHACCIFPIILCLKILSIWREREIIFGQSRK